jgi:CheY-like chemotaxis protein
LPLIFDEFYQVGVSPNSSREGYGLGLSIVRRILKLLGVPIDVRSEPGRGSVFAIDVPLAAPQAVASEPRRAPAPARDPAIRRARILLVEDDARVRNAMRTFLKLEGFDILAAATSEEAVIELQGEAHIDLVLTDYHLEPGHTGTQVIAAARELRSPDMPAILVTGDTSPAVNELQRDARLRITSKPINSRELLSLIRTLLAG